MLMLKVMPTNNINFRLFGFFYRLIVALKPLYSLVSWKFHKDNNQIWIANYRLKDLFHILAEQYHAIDYTRFVFEAITFIGAIVYLVLAITNIAETGRRRFIDMLKVREW